MMELGIGLSVIKQMPAMMEGMMPNPTDVASPGSMPPPVKPAAQVYLAIDNTQAGPFTEEELIKLIQDDLLKPDSLVWKPGMATWTPAAQVADMNKLFILSKLK